MPHLRAVTRVLMTRSALRELARHAAASADGRETGGIVLGRDGGLGGDLHVLHCGDPGPAAVRHRSRFSRDVAHAQRLADAAAATDGSAWIGEWHTHLVDLPAPSDADLHTYRRLLDDPDTQLSRLLALIVLPAAGDDQLAVFAWSFTGSVLRQLPVVLDAAVPSSTTTEGPVTP
jgi:integrative and conjugative element protein (TIGR02256 family)